MNKRPPGAWATPRAVEQAHQLWLAHVPARQIAATLGTTSHSAIIAYGKRHGWPRRPSPIPLRPVVVATPAPAPVKPPLHGKRVAAARPLSVIAVFVPPPRECQWVMAEGRRGKGWEFCSAPTVRGGSWCQLHHRIVFQGRANPALLSWLARAA